MNCCCLWCDWNGREQSLQQQSSNFKSTPFCLLIVITGVCSKRLKLMAWDRFRLVLPPTYSSFRSTNAAVAIVVAICVLFCHLFFEFIIWKYFFFHFFLLFFIFSVNTICLGVQNVRTGAKYFDKLSLSVMFYCVCVTITGYATMILMTAVVGVRKFLFRHQTAVYSRWY